MTAILAIDPGSERSAWVLLDGDRIDDHGYADNEHVVDYIRAVRGQLATVVIETIEPWGGFTGPPALETMRWVGRFEQASWPTPATLVKRSDVLRVLGIGRLPSGQAQAAARACLIERWGGGNPAKRGHPLTGIVSHRWSALAVGVAWQEGER